MRIPVAADVSLYSQLHLDDLKLAHAIAELIDNSIGSYYRYKDKLSETLIVDIRCSENEFIIVDNAAGISAHDFSDVFIYAKRNSKDKVERDLGTYGVGMKRSALWIGSQVEFKSQSLLDKRTYSLTFDSENITDSIEINDSPDYSSSGLSLVISKLHKDNVEDFGIKVVERLRHELGLIYARFLASEEVFIRINDQRIIANERKVLFDRFYKAYVKIDGATKKEKFRLKDTGAPKLEWKINYETENSQFKIKGWLGIKASGDKRDLGIYIYRNGRGIFGIPPGEVYNPFDFNVGDTNYNRIIGEFDIEGFEKPTMGNALPQRAILDRMIDSFFRLDLRAKRISLAHSDLYNFFEQLSRHSPYMTDSQPVSLIEATVTKPTVEPPQEEYPYKIDDNRVPTKGLEPVIQISPEPEVKSFSFTIDSQQFNVILKKDSKKSLEYAFEGEILKIEICTERELNTLHLKLICRCVELFDVAKKITMGEIGSLEKLL